MTEKNGSGSECPKFSGGYGWQIFVVAEGCRLIRCQLVSGVDSFLAALTWGCHGVQSKQRHQPGEERQFFRRGEWVECSESALHRWTPKLRKKMYPKLEGFDDQRCWMASNFFTIFGYDEKAIFHHVHGMFANRFHLRCPYESTNYRCIFHHRFEKW